MKRVIAAVFMILLMAGCSTTAQEIRRPGGVRQYLITCGAGAGLKACYEKGNQVCPGGYDTLSEGGGVLRNELRIACPSAKKPME
jgi:hypothetical protein